MTSATSDLIGKCIINRYTIRKHLGGGSFGDVYEAEDLQTQQIVALKFETNDTAPQLPNEYKVYKTLEGMDGIPKVYGLFDYGKSRVLAMDQMGPSLEFMFRRCGKKFSLKTVLMIADQVLRIMEYVHQCGILHRDIKPQNFLVGRGALHNKVFLIDFGVSTTYIDPRTHEHMMYTNNNGLIGTAYYVSINTHLGDQQSRRDDLESVAYMLIRFMRGSLPWQGLKVKSPEERNEKITQMKIQTQPEVLCQGMPKEFKILIEVIRRLRFDEEPKYHWFRQIFTSLFLKKGYVYDSVFDWDEAAAIHKPLPSVFLNHSAARFQRGNERQIRARKEKVVLPEPRPIFFFGWRQQ
ncbi:CK1 family protein kinase [Tritrichomonas foetus]|uniref:non-specific serine/threonine protein kinase n=1 Tax=Tritrichomonas foetus TaxID=1144522 RepID=A0A1J4K5U3_9EUKA|nr:CK1 family protein kinase [Tritrichomonas foetus]|eukprot:OHT06531.1 CK1 family protein kinase [Tritrichomonas foetus]